MIERESDKGLRLLSLLREVRGEIIPYSIPMTASERRIASLAERLDAEISALSHGAGPTLPCGKQPGEPCNIPCCLDAPPSATLTHTVAAALGRIADGSPMRENSIHGPRLRCKHCGHAWVIGSEAEHHDDDCAYIVAKKALGCADGTAKP